MYKIIIGHKCLGYNTTKLPCGHCFHSSCITDINTFKEKRLTYCPICQQYIYTRREKQLLKNKKYTADDISYITNMEYERAMELLKIAIAFKGSSLIYVIITNFDPTELVHYYISTADTNSISILLNSKCLNWHRTFHGKTLIEAALDGGNPDVIHTILNKISPC